MRVLRLLALRRVRQQPMRALLAALVVGGGTSLVVTILVLSGSITASVNEAARALAGPAPLRVLGEIQRGGIDDATIERIRSTEGVRAVVPLVQSITMVDPGDGGEQLPVTILGFDCSVQALLGPLQSGCSDEELAKLTVPLVGPALAKEVGSRASVRTNLGRIPLDGAIAVSGLDRLNAGRIVALPMPLALEQLGRDGRVDVAYVLTDDGADVSAVQQRLERRLPGAFAVLDSLDPPPVVGIVFSTFLPLFTVIALLTLGIGGVLVRNSITLSLEERRRQTAIVGALGGSRGLLLGGTVLEAVLLGAVGGVLGVGAGVLLAGPVSGGIDEILRDVAGIPLEVHVPGIAVVAGVLLGIGVAVGSSIGPARRAVRIDVAAELASRGRREETLAATSVWRLLLAIAVVGAGVLLTRAAAYQGGIDQTRATLAPVGFLVAAAGSVYLVATAVPQLLALAERRISFQRAPARLALSNLRREPRRSAVMAIALGFAMGVGFITSSFKMSITEAISDQLDRSFEGIQVSSIDPNNSATNEARLGPDLIRQLERLPGVARVDDAAYAVLGNKAGSLIGVQAYTDPWDGIRSAAGRYTDAGLARGEVAIGPALARSDHLRPGDELALATPTGTVRLPIMSVQYDGSFAGRNVLMDHALFTRLYGHQQPTSVVLAPKRGVTDRDLLAALRHARLDGGRLIVEDRQQVIDRNAKEVQSQLSTFDAIQRGLLVMSFVAVLSTLLLVGVQRRKEFGMLGAVGMTPTELRRMVLLEAGMVAVGGVLVTGIGAMAMYTALNSIVPVIIGWHDPFVLDGRAYLVYSLVAVGTAVVAAIYPSLRAGRVEVLDALRYE